MLHINKDFVALKHNNNHSLSLFSHKLFIICTMNSDNNDASSAVN